MKKIIAKFNENRLLSLMILPGFIFMLIFNYEPMYGLYIAFTSNYSPTHNIFTADYVGLANFTYFLHDPYFWEVIRNTMVIAFGKLIIGFPLGIILAVMINELLNLRFKKVTQTISYLPYFLSWVILGGMIVSWLSPTGLVNEILINLHIIDDPVPFMSDPKYYYGVAVLTDVWKNLGWSTILYLAAMTAIDPTLYESAKMDGASKLRQIWHITLPGIRSIIALTLVLSVSGLLASNLDQALILQNNLNLSHSEVLDSYVMKVGLTNGDYSYATAIGLFRSVIAVILVVTSNKIASRVNDRTIF